jgi:hypothetical protein
LGGGDGTTLNERGDVRAVADHPVELLARQKQHDAGFPHSQRDRRDHILEQARLVQVFAAVHRPDRPLHIVRADLRQHPLPGHKNRESACGLSLDEHRFARFKPLYLDSVCDHLKLLRRQRREQRQPLQVRQDKPISHSAHPH